jgi:Arc/MetJ-type ribon-helix-helix transcriptional regulator
MDVELDENARIFIAEKMKDERFESPSEVLNAAVRFVQQVEAEDQARYDAFVTTIKDAIAERDRGDADVVKCEGSILETLKKVALSK